MLVAIGFGTGSASGCLSSSDETCPDISVDSELRYEVRDSGPLFEFESGTGLITRKSEISRFDEQVLEDSDIGWVENTNFKQAVVVGVQVGSSGASSNLQVLGVGQTNNTVQVYTCIKNRGESGDWAPYSKLLRVFPTAQSPTDSKLIHWEEDEKKTFGRP